MGAAPDERPKRLSGVAIVREVSCRSDSLLVCVERRRRTHSTAICDRSTHARRHPLLPVICLRCIGGDRLYAHSSDGYVACWSSIALSDSVASLPAVTQESKLTLHGLLQYYVKLSEKEKNRRPPARLRNSGCPPCCLGIARAARCSIRMLGVRRDPCSSPFLRRRFDRGLEGIVAQARCVLAMRCAALQAERLPRRPGVQPGRDLRQVCSARHRLGQAPGGVQLPVHRDPLRPRAGGPHGRAGAVSSLCDLRRSAFALPLPG